MTNRFVDLLPLNFFTASPSTRSFVNGHIFLSASLNAMVALDVAS
jgi:hypothetical protein